MTSAGILPALLELAREAVSGDGLRSDDTLEDVMELLAALAAGNRSGEAMREAGFLPVLVTAARGGCVVREQGEEARAAICAEVVRHASMALRSLAARDEGTRKDIESL